MATNSPSPTRWYREPLVWLVLAIPATAVAAGVAMLVLANATWDGLVADDYYQRGLQINRALARDAEAARLGLEATVVFPEPGVVEARLSTVDDASAVLSRGRLSLRFTRAARAGNDVRTLLIWDDAAVWRGELPNLTPGKWYIEIGNDDWRLATPVRVPAMLDGIVLRADASPEGER